MIKLLLGYVHLLATCIALGSILTTDWQVFRGRHGVLGRGAFARLLATRRIVLGSLTVLWLTGLTLVWLGYSANPQEYLTNEKLWAKVSVVMVLTLNGWLLHRHAFPLFGCATVLMDLAARKRFALAVLGALSSVSWLFAAFLGMARAWNYTVSYLEVLAIFGFFAGIAVLIALAFFIFGCAGRKLRSA